MGRFGTGRMRQAQRSLTDAHMHRQRAAVAVTLTHPYGPDHDIATGGLYREEAPMHVHRKVGWPNLRVAQYDVAVFVCANATQAAFKRNDRTGMQAAQHVELGKKGAGNQW